MLLRSFFFWFLNSPHHTFTTATATSIGRYGIRLERYFCRRRRFWSQHVDGARPYWLYRCTSVPLAYRRSHSKHRGAGYLGLQHVPLENEDDRERTYVSFQQHAWKWSPLRRRCHECRSSFSHFDDGGGTRLSYSDQFRYARRKSNQRKRYVCKMQIMSKYFLIFSQ